MFLRAFGPSLAMSSFFAVLYLSLEPFVRRRIPELLIGWASVLEGRLRDPRVGRDILVGGLMGSAMAWIFHLQNALPTWFRISGQTTIAPSYDAVAGGRYLVDFLAFATADALVEALFYFALYFVLRIFLRRPAVAAVGLAIILTLMSLGGENVPLETAFSAFFGIVATLVIARFGLLPAASFCFFRTIVNAMPLPLDFSSAYVTQSVIILLALAVLTLYAFRISLGSRHLLAIPLED